MLGRSADWAFSALAICDRWEKSPFVGKTTTNPLYLRHLGQRDFTIAPPPIGALLTLWSSGNVEETSAIVELWLGIRKALQSQNLKGFVLPQCCRHLFTVCLCPQYVATLVFVLVRPFLRQLTLRCFPLPDTPPHWSARPTVIGYEPPPKDFANYLDQQVIRLGPTGNKKKLTIINTIKPL